MFEFMKSPHPRLKLNSDIENFCDDGNFSFKLKKEKKSLLSL